MTNIPHAVQWEQYKTKQREKDMCSSFLEHFLHFWNITRGLRPILCFFCPRNAGSFCCRMIFRNQDLQWAHCYWGVIASRPSQWTELENVCFYVHIDLCIYHYFYISIYIHFKSMSLFSSVQFSRSVVSNSLRPHESQHTRPPCPSPTPGVHSDSRHRVSDAIQQLEKSRHHNKDLAQPKNFF